MKESEAKQWIARRAARELKDGQIANLGIGIPSMIPAYMDQRISVNLQSENGMLGIDHGAADHDSRSYIVNAGGERTGIKKAGAFFDSAMSFAMIRGGHIDITILGAYQVDEKGSLANWCIPGKAVSGMGGAMDCVTGAKKVIVTMLHTRNGIPKILKECTLPLTALNCVNKIITEMAVIDVTEAGLVLTEINPVFSLDEVMAMTGARLLLKK